MIADVDPTANPVLVAFDPGKTTGCAMYRYGGLPHLDAEFSSGEIEGRFDFYDYFDDLTIMGAPLFVVGESFVITGLTAQKSPQYDALYILGAIESKCHKLGYTFCLSPPSNKKFAADDKLKALGWFSRGHGHANDAARHVLHATVSQRLPGCDDLLERITGAVLGGAA